MLRKILNKLFRKRNIKYRFTVPPHAEFNAEGITVINSTDEVVDIWTENFPERRKEDKEDREETELNKEEVFHEDTRN